MTFHEENCGREGLHREEFWGWAHCVERPVADALSVTDRTGGDTSGLRPTTPCIGGRPWSSNVSLPWPALP